MPSPGSPRTPGRRGLPPALVLVPAGVSLLAGLDAALVLAGLPSPVEQAELGNRHGMLMVLGFLGTLISLERAVALRRPWAYLAPALLGAGGVALALGVRQQVGTVLFVDGLLALLGVYAALFARQRDEATAVEILGVVAALVASVLWLRVAVYTLVPWLVAYIVLVIGAERVELARLHRPKGSERTLLALGVVVIAGAAATLAPTAWGDRAFGGSLLALTAWTSLGDVARRNVRRPGLPRFSGWAMLLGYAWLAAAALTWVAQGRPGSVGTYDTVVHGVFLGFAMSMVMGHAPIILPAVIRRPLPYHPVLWVPLLVLHAGLVLRVCAGDWFGVGWAWRLGIWLTLSALLLLPVLGAALVATARPVVSARRTGRRTVVERSAS